MTKLQHWKNPEGRVVQAAPHPAENGVKPDEYYMIDPPRDSNCFFLPYPGKTHAVLYSAPLKGEARISCHALENWQQVDQFVGKSLKEGVPVANKPQQLIADLRKKADELEKWLEKNPQPEAADFQGMPYVGMRVWVEHPGEPGTLVHIKVTGMYVTGGEVCVVTEGWKYFRPGHWFWTKEAAETSLQKV